MKKFALVMAFILVFSALSITTATAEHSQNRFTIHSGVTFGMTKSEVERLETEAGFTVRSDGELEGYELCPLHGSNLYLSGTIAGIKGSTIYYHFNSDDQLESAIYHLGHAVKTDNLSSTCWDLHNALWDKYGFYDDNTEAILEARLLDTCIMSAAVASSTQYTKYKYLDDYAYTVTEGNNTIIIYLIETKYNILNQMDVYDLFIEYHIYSTEEYNAAMKKRNDDL